MSRITDVQRKHRDELIAKKGVNGVMVGKELKDGAPTGRTAIICLVEEKLPLESIDPEDLVPSSVDDMPTDVIEIGKLKALGYDDRVMAMTSKIKMRPAPIGVSVGHFAITAGTIGALCRVDDKLCILSNNHVLANENNAEKGDYILQPGAIDGGTILETIAYLYSYVPINFPSDDPTEPPPAPEPPDDGSSCPIARVFERAVNATLKFLKRGTRIKTVAPQVTSTSVNYVDAAIAEVHNPENVINTILNSPYGDTVNGVNEQPFIGDEVYKSGRTTGITEGQILGVNAVVDVEYDNGVARFHDQTIATAMSAGGDSGSLVMDLSNNAVGLLFAGSTTVTIMNPIQPVLDAFNAELV